MVYIFKLREVEMFNPVLCQSWCRLKSEAYLRVSQATFSKLLWPIYLNLSEDAAT